MPLVTVTTLKPKTLEFKNAVLDAVHGALVAAGVPKNDLFQRVFEMDGADFRFDPAYPDEAPARSPDFVLVEILFSVGRSVKVKRKILADLIEAMTLRPGLSAEDVMVVFKETGWENWAFRGGRMLHA